MGVHTAPRSGAERILEMKRKRHTPEQIIRLKEVAKGHF
jgi:hypothetical protein